MPPLSIHSACLAAIFSHSFYTAVRLALALLTLRLTQSPAAVGLVMMAYALLPAWLSPRIGRAADRHGVRPLLHLCLGLLLVCAAALSWLPHHTAVLGVVAAGVGLAFNTFAVSIQKLIGSLPPSPQRPEESALDRRKRYFGTLATASSVSSFAGPLLAGWGMDRASAAAVFGLLGVLPMLAWVLTLGWKIPPAMASVAAAGPGMAPARERAPLLTRELWPLALAIVMLTLAGDALAFLTPLIGQQQGLSATAVGAIVSTFAAGAFAVRLASGLFIARLQAWTYLSLTLAVSAILLLTYGHLAATLSLAAMAFVLGAWLGLAQPMTQSLMHQSVPENRVGEALGTRLALVGSAQAGSPLLLGFGVQTLGIVWTLALTSGVLIASAMYVARAARATNVSPRAQL